jgi:hypothetical protein
MAKAKKRKEFKVVKPGDYVEVTKKTIINGEEAEVTTTVKGKVWKGKVWNGSPCLAVGPYPVFGTDGTLLGDWEVVEHRHANPPEPGVMGLVRTRDGHLWIRIDEAWEGLSEKNGRVLADYDDLDVAFVVFEGGDHDFCVRSFKGTNVEGLWNGRAFQGKQVQP